ncbi:MAG TPA: hypothetical protein PLP05_03690 [Sedimentisphaerales bacterium]|nr:hypothetical protein [Sedimentisphaerales bacterium]
MSKLKEFMGNMNKFALLKIEIAGADTRLYYYNNNNQVLTAWRRFIECVKSTCLIGYKKHSISNQL